MYGSPASGKTTFVRNHLGENDIVVDLDSIMNAISGNHIKHPEKTHPDYSCTMALALAIRDTLYELISSRVGLWENAYVITSQSDERKIDELSKRLVADVIYMDISQDECIRRAERDDTRKDKEKEKSLLKCGFTKIRLAKRT